jgi:cholesterol transport system auxiliary component
VTASSGVRGLRLNAYGWLTLSAGLLSTGLVGCSALLHSSARPDQVYFLRAKPIQSAAESDPLKASLRFTRPSANPGLDTEQIVLVQSDRRMGFYLASRWPAPTADMIQVLAVEKLRGSHLWQAVADSTSGFPSDYILQTTVRDFEADYSGGGVAPDVRVVLDCVVGRRQDREVIASFLAKGEATADANKLSSVIAAFETAANAALDSMSAQTVAAVRTAMAHQTADAN